MATNVSWNQHLITQEIFDLPCALKAAKSFDAVNWKASSFLQKLRPKSNCLRIYGELVSKEFSFQFSRKCKTHRSVIKCLVQLKIYLCCAATEPFLVRACSKVVTQRVRNREPSRVPSQKVLQSLKFRKLRHRREKMLQYNHSYFSKCHSKQSIIRLNKVVIPLAQCSANTFATFFGARSQITTFQLLVVSFFVSYDS